MRVLVTGGTGYLGASIVGALHRRGHHPVVFARRASAAGLPGVAYDGDIRDRRALQLAAADTEAIVHAAALVSLWRPFAHEFDDVNVGGLLNVLDVTRARGIPRVVYTSSFLALPPAGENAPLEANDYQRTKVRALEAARAAAAAGVPIVTMFPGVIYGPGAATEGNLVGRLIRDHLQGRMPGLIGADQPWSYAYVTDVAEAHVEAVERAAVCGEYRLGGENVPQMRVFEVVRHLTGRPLPRRIPFAVAHAAALVEDMRASWFGRPPVLTRGTVQIFRRDWSLDSQRSAAELSYRLTPLATGLRDLLATL
ncbi:MAG: NAD-dependent epimerase/dehydratase family protein [Acidobacteria bacterium]|nr:NAD-dependent epimerase/dehydratase family protein [Acidobacteriota bacterium]